MQAFSKFIVVCCLLIEKLAKAGVSYIEIVGRPLQDSTELLAERKRENNPGRVPVKIGGNSH